LKNVRLLFLGDVVGPSGAEYVCTNLGKIIDEERIDFTIINSENSAKGNGIDKESSIEMLKKGADVITTGNHAFKQYSSFELFENNSRILRPANFPTELSGNGYGIFEGNGLSVLVINLLGTVNMEPLSCPFRTAEKILKNNDGKYDISVIDMHAEATSEKYAIASYFDGKVGAVIGTHTHVQTADEHILPNGTAFITDAGMCGPKESALGVKPECIIKKLMNHTPVKFELSDNPCEIHGVIVEFDMTKKLPVSIERYRL